MKFSVYLLNSLKQRGIDRVFGVPGRENARILFNEVEGIEYVTTRIEFNAGIMADFTARMTQKPQVAFCTMGPGATNMVTAVASSMLNHSPLLLISAQLESDDRYYNLTHQCVDQRAIFEPITKASIELDHAEQLPSALKKAFSLITGEPVGPVHLSVPSDFWEKDIGMDDELFEPVCSNIVWPSEKASEDEIREIYNILNDSESPMVLVGNEAIRAKSEEEIRRFCKSWNISLLASANAKGIFPHDDPLNIGSASCYMEGILQYDTALADLFDDVDVIVNIGYQYVDDILPSMWARGKNKKIINLSAFSSEPIAKKYKPTLEVIGKISDTLHKLNQLPPIKKSPINTANLLNYSNSVYMQTSDGGSMTPIEIIRVINENIDNGILITDIGYYRHHAILFSRPSYTNQFFTDAGLSSFGTGLPSAAAAQFQDRSKSVFLLCGDGGFHSGSGDLETIARHKLPVVIIVLNNNSFELIKRYQRRGNNGSNEKILDFSAVDFVKLADANGIPSALAGDAKSLNKILRERDFEKPLLVEVPMEYHKQDQFKESF